MIRLLILLAILAHCAQAAQVRFIGWGVTLSDFSVAGNPGQHPRIDADILSRPYRLALPERRLELTRQSTGPDGKPERIVLASAEVSQADTDLLAILVPLRGATTPYGLLLFPEPSAGNPAAKDISFFNFSQVPVAVQVGESPVSRSAPPEWPSPPRQLSSLQSARWEITADSSRVPVRIAAQDVRNGWRPLFARNLQSLPGHRSLIFIREASEADGTSVAGENIVYKLVHAPLAPSETTAAPTS